MWERLLGKQVESCALASKWWALAALLQMTPIRAGFARPKACDIVAEDAFSVASQHSISLIDIKCGTFMSPQSRYVTCYVQNFPACSHERFPLVGTECFENSRQETYNIEGSCKVYVGKTSWKTSWKLCLCKQEVKSTWNTLADDSYSRSI